MAITLEQVRLAMNAVAEATPETRRHALTALMAAGTELAELVARQQQWLIKEDDWLTANHSDPDWDEREERYITRLKKYQDSCTVLGAALEMIGKETT
jgi:hypothetical protein